VVTDGNTNSNSVKIAKSLNEYISACKVQRGSWNLGNKMKSDFQQKLYYYLYSLPQFKRPIKITFTWIEKNKRRDLDNVSAVGRKFILDTLQMCGKIRNDNLNYVVGFRDEVEFRRRVWSNYGD